jgi:hypothetical protein
VDEVKVRTPMDDQLRDTRATIQTECLGLH